MIEPTEVDKRLARALAEARSSALGMPATVETVKAMLDRAGLALTLKAETIHFSEQKH